MTFAVPDEYIAERMRIASVAAEWRRLTPAQKRDRVAFRMGQEVAAGRIKSGSLRASEASAEPAALGLVSYATKDRDETSGQEKRPLRERFKIDRDAGRCKRMRVSVSNGARVLHWQAHCERSAQRWNLKFLTLTYRKADGWRPGHLGAFRKAFNHWCVSHKVRARFVWVAELQERGAVHYHMVVWLPKGKFLPAPDKGQRHAWWPHGSTNIQTAQNPIGYLMKYASKATAASAASYPAGCRMFGVGGLDKSGREEVRYWRAPMWVRDAMPGTADIRKTVGGYVDAHTGEFLRSPWRVCVGPDGQVWAFKVDQSETVQ
ncbi:rolling circle replication-associated protein [Rhodanobacter lindaniclasticus]|uniref:Replication-associated protein ORF2/G2P domain-containing protein n=1 Tax=Rhodanobacter lindaniclasticus TaxID=75310 RepID=A0A4S3KDD7_9GAMM|nr:replication initiation protein [Rhodanobacter lindaniclasticus]THD06467.1 hypothetical protein B1991_12920 [Rhodanobacter lindaniclasticus]